MIKSPGSWQICIQSRMLLYTCYLQFCSHHNNLGKPVATSQTIAECEATDNRGSSSDKHNSKTCKATVKSQTSTLLCSARSMSFTSTRQHSHLFCTLDALHIANQQRQSTEGKFVQTKHKNQKQQNWTMDTVSVHQAGC